MKRRIEVEKMAIKFKVKQPEEPKEEDTEVEITVNKMWSDNVSIKANGIDICLLWDSGEIHPYKYSFDDGRLEKLKKMGFVIDGDHVKVE